MAASEALVRQVTAEDWMRQGACRGLSHLFFPGAAERPQARGAPRGDGPLGVRGLRGAGAVP